MMLYIHPQMLDLRTSKWRWVPRYPQRVEMPRSQVGGEESHVLDTFRRQVSEPVRVAQEKWDGP